MNRRHRSGERRRPRRGGQASPDRPPAAGSLLSDPLLTDLYQLTMLQAYLAEGMTDSASFELFVRRLPSSRNFLVAAGLETALAWLEALRFDEAELEWLAGQERFDARLLDYLAEFRFRGDVDAVPEGTVVFPDEPLLRVTAPLPQAQLVESRLINLLQFQTVVASKAARCMLAAQGRQLVDFGLRRAHGGEAALLAARAAYLAGFHATSAVAAGRAFGLPLAGTMAHSYVQAHRTEIDAYRQFARVHPHGVTLLIDTYDTEAAARTLVSEAPALRAAGVELAAVRLDSGDLAAHARAVRAILDAGDLGAVRIFASGGIDEHGIAHLLAQGAPIDGFGVGTALVTSEDAPALDCAYKLVAYAGEPRRKRSEGKATWPAPKQVYRHCDERGFFLGDTVALADEVESGVPLLQPVMRGGRRVVPNEPLATVRTRCAGQLAALPKDLRGLSPAAAPYPVRISDGVRRLAADLDRPSH